MIKHNFCILLVVNFDFHRVTVSASLSPIALTFSQGLAHVKYYHFECILFILFYHWINFNIRLGWFLMPLWRFEPGLYVQSSSSTLSFPNTLTFATMSTECCAPHFVFHSFSSFSFGYQIKIVVMHLNDTRLHLNVPIFQMEKSSALIWLIQLSTLKSKVNRNEYQHVEKDGNDHIKRSERHL